MLDMVSVACIDPWISPKKLLRPQFCVIHLNTFLALFHALLKLFDRKRGWIIPHRIPSDIEKLYFFFRLPVFPPPRLPPMSWHWFPNRSWTMTITSLENRNLGIANKWRDRPKLSSKLPSGYVKIAIENDH